MRAWAITGRPLAEFWGLTFREIGWIFDGLAEARVIHQQDLIFAAHTAEGMRRTKRLPKLRDVLPVYRPRRRKPDLDGMKRKLQAWAAVVAQGT